MTNKSTKRRNAVIAAVAGAALLLGGSTYALWQASADLDGGTITAGQLAITAGDTNPAWDISEDRTDGKTTAPGGYQAHVIESIDPETGWRMVPGDRVAMAFPFEITLRGDNLVAQLSIDADFSDVVQTTAPADVTIRYRLFDEDWNALMDEADLPTGQGNFPLAYFQDSNVGQEGGLLEDDDVIIPTLGVDGKLGISFVLYIEYAKSSNQSADMNKPLFTLGSVNEAVQATLTQVRCTDAVASNFNSLNCPVVDPSDPDDGQ